jgi:hypothetical protein
MTIHVGLYVLLMALIAVLMWDVATNRAKQQTALVASLFTLGVAWLLNWKLNQWCFRYRVAGRRNFVLFAQVCLTRARRKGRARRQRLAQA